MTGSCVSRAGGRRAGAQIASRIGAAELILTFKPRTFPDAAPAEAAAARAGHQCEAGAFEAGAVAEPH